MSTKLAIIHRITRLRINQDGIGVRTVIFFYGCPLSCRWCCNPETRFGNQYEEVSVDQLFNLIKRDIVHFDYSYGGLTFSGGEPLLYADFIKQFIQNYKKFVQSFNIETSLFADYDKIKELLPLIDAWYVDFKNINDNLHVEQTGKSNSIVLQNLQKLVCDCSPEKVVVCIPLIPQKKDSTNEIQNTIIFLKQVGIKNIQIHPYRKYTEQKWKNLKIGHSEIPNITKEEYEYVSQQFVKNGFTLINSEMIEGKEKCNYLKVIRKKYCSKHDIPLEIPKCDYLGECCGTCPQCESELKIINDFRKLYEIS